MFFHDSSELAVPYACHQMFKTYSKGSQRQLGDYAIHTTLLILRSCVGNQPFAKLPERRPECGVDRHRVARQPRGGHRHDELLARGGAGGRELGRGRSIQHGERGLRRRVGEEQVARLR